jgi:glucose-6-phosphate 1-dehydrogenase
VSFIADRLLLFGATGDLSKRMLLPSLCALDADHLLDPKLEIVGTARSEMDDQGFRNFAREALEKFLPADRRGSVATFLNRLSYQPLDATQEDGFGKLAGKVGTPQQGLAIFLSTAPSLFEPTIRGLERASLTGDTVRIGLEKPLGTDLASSRIINDAVASAFPEDRIFRIDHYLGKETVQNLLALRFANQLWEPIWNANYVDHIQITMAEDIGIGGRAGYYDGIGAARDVIQNHLLQLLALTAMEEPITFDARELRAEKEKVLSAVRVPKDLDRHTARGQYAHGWQGNEPVIGYLQEDGIPPDSGTETFAAIRLDIDTRRWAGVPFYLRAGKRLGRRVTEIAVVFKRAPHLPFDNTATEELGQNALVIRVQPDEGVTIRFGSKVPGTSMEVRDVNMDFAYGHAFTESSPEAYERLILDVLLGDPPLFPRHEEVELSWKILDPITAHWAKGGQPEPYDPGNWGPQNSHDMMARDGRTWRRP